MVRRIFALMALILCAISSVVFADNLAENYDYTSFIIDDAEVLTQEDKDFLAKDIKNVSKKYNLPMLIVTSNTLDVDKMRSKAESFLQDIKYKFDKDKSAYIFVMNLETRKASYICTGNMQGLTKIGTGSIDDKVKEEYIAYNYRGMFNTILNFAKDYVMSTWHEVDITEKPGIDCSRYIIDDANLLTSDEKTKLVDKISKTANGVKISLVLVTSNDVQKGKYVSYADDTYDNGNFGLDSEKSGALLLLDMNNRKIYISTTGKMIDILSDIRINAILDSLVPHMKEKEYYKTFELFIESCNKFIYLGPEGDSYKHSESQENDISKMDLFIAIVLGGVAALTFYYSVYRKYSFKARQYIYNLYDNTDLDLDIKQDTFIRENITRTRIESSSNSSGSSHSGSSTHIGSSGTRHGGGGRSF